MAEPRGIVSYHLGEYGRVKVKLAELLDKNGITRNRLKTLTGAKYDVITRYYKGEDIAMADLDFLAKVCYSLNCKIEDILEYEEPEESEEPTEQ